MTAAVLASVLCVLAYGIYRRWLVPACPRCRAKRWDRKLCQPLLFCRSCATRCDAALRVYT